MREFFLRHGVDALMNCRVAYLRYFFVSVFFTKTRSRVTARPFRSRSFIRKIARPTRAVIMCHPVWYTFGNGGKRRSERGGQPKTFRSQRGVDDNTSFARTGMSSGCGRSIAGWHIGTESRRRRHRSSNEENRRVNLPTSI